MKNAEKRTIKAVGDRGEKKTKKDEHFIDHEHSIFIGWFRYGDLVKA